MLARSEQQCRGAAKTQAFPALGLGFNSTKEQNLATTQYPLKCLYCSNWLSNTSVPPTSFLRLNFCKQEETKQSSSGYD